MDHGGDDEEDRLYKRDARFNNNYTASEGEK